MEVHVPHEMGIFQGKGSPIVKYWDFLPWAVQKWLNLLICRLGCGLGWAEESTSSVVFARWCQCAHMGGHIAATWWIQLNHASAATMQSYVKLLWPLVTIIRPHYSPMHVDAVYSYRPSSVMCLSVCHTSEPCKTDELIEMSLGSRSWMGPGNHD